MRLGIFGGSFDPVHNGHLLLADCCWRQLELDEIRYLPAASQPLKPSGPHATDEQRIAMLQLGIAGRRGFVVSEREIARGGTSFTVDSLQEVASEQPDAELYFLMGGDALADLPRWRQPQEICRLATPAVVRRAGLPAPDYSVLEPIVTAVRLQEIRAAQVEMPEMAVSSSEIRELVSSGGDWQEFVPKSVAAFIEQHRVYDTPGGTMDLGLKDDGPTDHRPSSDGP